MDPQTTIDVLIVGAGPTGMTLALELAIQNRHLSARGQSPVSFRIVDRLPAASPHSRATGVQPRTQELLARYDPVAFRRDVLARGSLMRGITWRFTETRSASIQFDDVGIDDAEFPLSLSVSQTRTEAFLEGQLDRAMGGGQPTVERRVAAESVVQDPDGVTVILTRCHDDQDPATSIASPPVSPATVDKDHHADRETVRCKYVVGCDGARSVVRKAAPGILFEGETYPHDFILCDTHISDTSVPRDRITIGLNGFFSSMFPVDEDMFRVASMRSVDPDSAEDPAPTLGEFQSMLDSSVAASGRLHDPQWMASFRLHRRCASAYRAGRLFIAGDAAHIHSPVAGQGMNASIQDAVNLGWKLAAVVSAGGEDKRNLLDTYEAERRPVGLALTHTTDRMFRFFTLRHRALVWLRAILGPWLQALLMSSRKQRRRLFNWVSELGLNYRGSSLASQAAGFVGPVMGGDRMPDGRLLLCAPASPVDEEGAGGSAGGISGDNNNKDNGDPPGETRLHRVCGDGKYHLLLFCGDATGEELARAAAQVTAARNDVAVVTIFPSSCKEEKTTTAPPNAYRDPDNTLHARYGFAKYPGYVLGRPDGYVAHVGHLRSLSELMSYL